MHVHAGLNLSIPHTCPHAHIHTNAHTQTTKLKENPESYGYCNCQGATGGIYVILILILWLRWASSSPSYSMSIIFLLFLSHLFLYSHLSPAGRSSYLLEQSDVRPGSAGCLAEQLPLLQNLWISCTIVKSFRVAPTSPKGYSHQKQQKKISLPRIILLLSWEDSWREER